MELRLKHCVVRGWRLDDAKSLARHANNRRVWLGLRDQFPHPYTIADANVFLQGVINKQPVTNFCIEIEAAAAGGLGIRVGEDVHRQTANLGYWLGEEFWDRGIMTEVVSAVVNYYFEKFPLNRIDAEVYSNNPASARVLEKAGFVLEGRLRKNVVKEGEILDSLLYARTT